MLLQVSLLRFSWSLYYRKYTLAVKLETTHKPAKPPTNQLNHLHTTQTALKPAKYQTNHLLICQKMAFLFPRRRFFMNRNIFPWPSHAKRETDAFFDVPARFRISPSPLHSSLTSLIADYNPSHKLLTQLQTFWTIFYEQFKTIVKFLWAIANFL